VDNEKRLFEVKFSDNSTVMMLAHSRDGARALAYATLRCEHEDGQLNTDLEIISVVDSAALTALRRH